MLCICLFDLILCVPSTLFQLCRDGSCADPGIFVRGGGSRSVCQKKLTTFFFSVLSLFYRSQMVNFKEIYHFSRFQRRSNIFQGGPTFSGGIQLLIPIETHITCDFPGGSGPPAPAPLWICTCGSSCIEPVLS